MSKLTEAYSEVQHLTDRIEERTDELEKLFKDSLFRDHDEMPAIAETALGEFLDGWARLQDIQTIMENMIELEEAQELPTTGGPRLVYLETGNPVKIGDVVSIGDGEQVKVTYFRIPHKPNSQGKVSVEYVGDSGSREFYVSVIGAEWINRTDQSWEQDAADELVKEVDAV